MEDIIRIALVIVASYFIGSFPTAVVISKRYFGFDLREQGSGNMGSTNAFRVLGWKWGLTVQILDIMKGIIAVLIVAPLFATGVTFPNATSFEHLTIIKLLAGLSAVCGHIWSVFVKFNGGKGINTATGMMIAVLPMDVSIAALIFIIAVIFSGYISLGSIAAAFTIPSSLLLRYNCFHVDIPGYSILIYFSFALMLLVLYTHRANIRRLINGEENRFNKLHLIKLNKAKKEN